MDASAVTELISLIVIGAIAGWLAGLVLKGRGFGLLGNIIVGIIGSFIGTFVGGMLSNVVPTLFSPLINTIIWSTIGAIILLVIIGLVKKR